MKKLLSITLTLAFSFALLTACNGTADYEGTWSRTGTYVNGAIVSTEPATLVINKNSYTSTNECEVTGALSVVEDQMTMTVETNTCPGPDIISEITQTYTVKIDEEGKEVMTFEAVYAGQNIMETYVR